MPSGPGAAAIALAALRTALGLHGRPCRVGASGRRRVLLVAGGRHRLRAWLLGAGRGDPGGSATRGRRAGVGGPCLGPDRQGAHGRVEVSEAAPGAGRTRTPVHRTPRRWARVNRCAATSLLWDGQADPARQGADPRPRRSTHARRSRARSRRRRVGPALTPSSRRRRRSGHPPPRPAGGALAPARARGPGPGAAATHRRAPSRPAPHDAQGPSRQRQGQRGGPASHSARGTSSAGPLRPGKTFSSTVPESRVGVSGTKPTAGGPSGPSARCKRRSFHRKERATLGPAWRAPDEACSSRSRQGLRRRSVPPAPRTTRRHARRVPSKGRRGDGQDLACGESAGRLGTMLGDGGRQRFDQGRRHGTRHERGRRTEADARRTLRVEAVADGAAEAGPVHPVGRNEREVADTKRPGTGRRGQRSTTSPPPMLAACARMPWSQAFSARSPSAADRCGMAFAWALHHVVDRAGSLNRCRRPSALRHGVGRGGRCRTRLPRRCPRRVRLCLRPMSAPQRRTPWSPADAVPAVRPGQDSTQTAGQRRRRSHRASALAAPNRLRPLLRPSVGERKPAGGRRGREAGPPASRPPASRATLACRRRGRSIEPVRVRPVPPVRVIPPAASGAWGRRDPTAAAGSASGSLAPTATNGAFGAEPAARSARPRVRAPTSAWSTDRAWDAAVHASPPAARPKVGGPSGPPSLAVAPRRLRPRSPARGGLATGHRRPLRQRQGPGGPRLRARLSLAAAVRAGRVDRRGRLVPPLPRAGAVPNLLHDAGGRVDEPFLRTFEARRQRDRVRMTPAIPAPEGRAKGRSHEQELERRVGDDPTHGVYGAWTMQAVP